MIKNLKPVGNSKGIIIDSALLEMANWREDEQLSVTVHEGGAMTFTPTRDRISPEGAAETAKSLIGKNSELFRRLSQ